MAWESPALAAFYRRLATFSRLILFDKRGTGLSDRVPEDRLSGTYTGERYENRCCGVFETSDGKITAVREYLDTQRMGAVLFGR